MTSKKTYETSYTQPELDKVPQSRWDEVSEYVDAIDLDTDFIEHTSHLDEQSLAYTKARYEYIDELVTAQGESIDDTTAAQIRLMAGAPHIVRLSEEISTTQMHRKSGNYLPQAEFNALRENKRSAVKYNQLLSTYMHDNPADSFFDMRQHLIAAALDSDPYHAEKTEQTVDNVMQGARVEAVTRALFEQAGIPHRAATTEEDLRGADIIVTFHGKEYPVDLKKSLDQLAAVAGGYEFAKARKMYVVKSYRGNKNILLFPGFEGSQLGDRLTLDKTAAEDVCQVLQIQMMRAINEF